MKAGKLLKQFRDQFPKQHKETRMLYAGRYSAAAIDTIAVHQILVSDEGLFELKHVVIGPHPNAPKTPLKWRAWLDKHYTRILGAVVQTQEKERGGLWKVRAVLGWSEHAARRKHSAMAPGKRNKTKNKGR